MKSTNYYNTFISVAEECKRETGTIPTQKSPPTVASLKYELISINPYKYTSDEILFEIYSQRIRTSKITDFDTEKQACFRCSPLAKSYGWGFHFDVDGRVALYGMESVEYQQFLDDGDLKHKAAFSTKRYSL